MTLSVTIYFSAHCGHTGSPGYRSPFRHALFRQAPFRHVPVSLTLSLTLILPVPHVDLGAGLLQYADNRPTIITLVGMAAVGMVRVGMVPAHRVGGCPTGPPVGGVTSTSTPALWPCAVLWPCTFCSDRSGVVVYHHSRCAVVRWLIVVIYCPSRGWDVRSTG